MKKAIFLAAAACLLSASSALAKANVANVEGILIDSIDAAISEDRNLLVSMDIDLTKVKIKSNQEYIVKPYITNGIETLMLQPVTFAGRNRYYFHERNEKKNPFMVRNGKDAVFHYRQSVPMQEWMNQSTVEYEIEMDGCCNEPQATAPGGPIARIDNGPKDFIAEFLYIPPQAEGTKIRHKDGSAFIDFVVNKTDINPEYRNNPAELAKIIATIDDVRGDKDITIKNLYIKGFASPEGPYDNNVRLAKGRTQSLKEYVRQLYNFPESIMHTDYEPEDWEGLRKYVDASNLDNREGILAIIDSDLEPDAKNTKIQKTYPAQYEFLLKNEYPALRHSDYVIEYSVRTYTSVPEILAVMEENPGKLDLNEFYLAANSFPVGSEEYNNIFDIAVRMFPNDPIANLNAANASMSRGDYKTAARFLGKAGNSDEVSYAKGILAALQRDFDTAENIFQTLPSLDKAQKALEQVRDLKQRAPVKLINNGK